MAGLDPATQCAHVRARVKTFSTSTNNMRQQSLVAASTRGRWVAGSSPAMTSFFIGYRARASRHMPHSGGPSGAGRNSLVTS